MILIQKESFRFKIHHIVIKQTQIHLLKVYVNLHYY